MKYFLNIRSRPDSRSSITTTHERIAKGLSTFGDGWGLKPSSTPLRVSEKDAEFLAVVTFTKRLPNGMKGSVNYSNRATLRDAASSDDWLNIEFDPIKVNYKSLLTTWLTEYIRLCDAYVAYIKEPSIVISDRERLQYSQVNARHGIARIWPVSYFDADLCRKAFKLRPAKVCDRLRKNVHLAEVFRDGVLLISTTDVLNPKQIAAESLRIRKLLP